MNRWAVVCFYNDGPLLERCLKSLDGLKILCVDGPYKDFPHTTTHSDKETLSIAHKYADVLISGKEWADQVEKRNASIKSIPVGDTFIVIDADEELVGEVPSGNWQVKIVADTDPDGYWWGRIFTKTKNLRYDKTHMSLFDEGLVNYMSFPKSEVVIKHHNTSRSPERYEDKETYRKKQREYELKWREEHWKKMNEGKGTTN